MSKNKKESAAKRQPSEKKADGENFNIVWLTSEAAPFAMTGGLADVSASLPEALAERGASITVIMPYYPKQMGEYNHKVRVVKKLIEVPFNGRQEWTQALEYKKSENLKFLFIEYHRYFDRRSLYDWNGMEYGDNAERFIFFCRAAMQTIIALDLHPDIIHANDWHSALACLYLKSNIYKNYANFAKTGSVLTIHNIAYQGCYHKSQLYFTGLGWNYFNYLCLEFYDQINLLKGGIMTADIVTTVSPTHADEILSPDYGFNLDYPLRHKALQGRLRGILNGIDVKAWNPKADKLIPANYSASDMRGKAVCKKFLQEKLGLPQRNDIPIFGIISRLAYQKGIDVFASAAANMLLRDDVQFVALASGNQGLEGHLAWLASKNPSKFSYTPGYDNRLSHMIEAGADIFVMPSRYEPCGLNQMYSMRYGTLPLVRATGGLDDTVTNYDRGSLLNATGFKFWDLTADALANTMRWAAAVFRNEKDSFRKIQINGMSKDFSWNKTAVEYEEAYRIASGRLSRS
jgi:starch synthase